MALVRHWSPGALVAGGGYVLAGWGGITVLIMNFTLLIQTFARGQQLVTRLDI